MGALDSDGGPLVHDINYLASSASLSQLQTSH